MTLAAARGGGAPMTVAPAMTRAPERPGAPP